jgi:hypothetical protein
MTQMAVTQPRPDLVAHAHSVRVPVPALVRELRELLGARLVAYLADVKETRAVHEWADDARTPNAETVRRLRVALQVALAIAEVDGPGVAQAWCQGLNPQLEDRSPARLLREGDLDEVGPAVIAASRAFLVGG